MKPAAFDYACPTTLDDALALLARYPGDAKALAGGQSLMPVLNFRLAAPKLIVDLRKLPGLGAIAIGADGVRLGARVRWRDIERDKALAAAHPLLAEAVTHIAHYQIRNRGTVGGSLAHADPAAELPGVAVACDAELALAGAKGRRSVRAGDFFTGALSTALAPEELIVELRLPAWPKARRWAFLEFARRRGDFALAGIALWYDEAAGKAKDAHIAVIGACTRPHRIAAAEAEVNGRTVDEKTILAAAAAAARAVDPPEDLHGSAAYRRALVETLVERALQRAAG